MRDIKTTCPYCGTGCGVVASASDDEIALRGDPEHPANFGKLCSKGVALQETLGMEGRLLHPEVDGVRVSWEKALDKVADGFRRIVESHGPDAVAFYVSGQLLTEDYYVANKLMKGFIGSANIDTNSRLCMASAVAGYRRAFGADAVPCCYEDLERAKLVVLMGSNLAWCHPVLYQRLAAAKRENPDLQIVAIDPRRTATCDIADLHLAIAPGTDAWLFNGLLRYLWEAGEVDMEFVEDHTLGFHAALTASQSATTSVVATHCGIAESDVKRFYRLFARTERVVSVYSQGINQSTSGTDKNNAIINVHLATRRIGRPGMGPFSVTGQPNAMGGREVGGLANQLACHMDFAPANCDRVQRFWQSPTIARQPGLKAVDLFQAIAAGRVKAVWIMATNPVVSLPDADSVRRALEACELVVVSDCVRDTDTVRLAHVRLPALSWGEKEGTVTNSERCISRQRAFMPPPGEARADHWIIAQVAARLGFGAHFDYDSPAAIFREHAALSAFENNGERVFDLSALAEISDTGYAQLSPVQWPVTHKQRQGTPRLFTSGAFPTQSGRAQLVPITPRPPANSTAEPFPFIMNTGRVRDHWHTMTRTGMSPRLSEHTPEPFAALHPADARALRIDEGRLVYVESTQGSALVRARIDDGQRRGEIFAPLHWNDTFSARARIDALVGANVDPISGQPESKYTPVRIVPWQPLWQGFLLSRDPVAPVNTAYWTRSRGPGLWRYSLAHSEDLGPWETYARKLLGEDGEWIEYTDGGRYRGARIVAGRLENCLFIDDRRLPETRWLEALFAQTTLSEAERRSLLLGKSERDAEPHSRIICACHGVSEKTIHAAILQGARDAQALGFLTKAGTGCGSCVPELRRIFLGPEMTGSPAK